MFCVFDVTWKIASDWVKSVMKAERWSVVPS